MRGGKCIGCTGVRCKRETSCQGRTGVREGKCMKCTAVRCKRETYCQGRTGVREGKCIKCTAVRCKRETSCQGRTGVRGGKCIRCTGVRCEIILGRISNIHIFFLLQELHHIFVYCKIILILSISCTIYIIFVH